jgi:hypothetical protein
MPRSSSQVCAQRFSQNFPQWLAIGALLTLLGACASPVRPARPEAQALPDTEQIATTPGAGARQRIVEIALHEWERWGRQTVRVGRDDTACVTYSPLPAPAPPLARINASDPIAALTAGETAADADTENDPADAEPGNGNCLQFPDSTGMEATAQGCLMAQHYWGIVGRRPDCTQVTEGSWAWSAVFISWVMRKAGLDDAQFLTGDSHSQYVVDARDGILPDGAFRADPVPGMPRPGDLVCAGRGRDKYIEDATAIRFGKTPMHCDIVVSVDPTAREVRAIGGNVQQSVSMDVIELGDSGKLDGVTNSHFPWVVILRNQLP